MYHIVANLEDRFVSLAEALSTYNTDKPVSPTIPETAKTAEEATTPRICVAPSIEHCITAIGTLGRFRRCLATNDDCKSYATDWLEVYPLLVVEFSDREQYYKPPVSAVPDVLRTRERWLLQPTIPISVTLKWVNFGSILLDANDPDICVKCTFVSGDIGSFNHLWLNGKGHPLESSAMEDEPMYAYRTEKYSVARHKAGFNCLSLH